MTTRKIQKHLGTLLMLVGISSIVYLYYPIALVYIAPQTSTQNFRKERVNEYSIEIPKIKAQSPIVTDVDLWNESVYKDALKKGVAHAKNTSLPGEGKTYLFAHSSDYPWNITRYNTAFFKLHQLEIGDKILIKNGSDTFTYAVSDVKEVWPTEVEYIQNQTDDLILQTCTPIGTDLKRLLVFANLDK